MSLINKRSFIQYGGCTDKEASRYALLLNRRMPSKTIKPTGTHRISGIGRRPTKHFDLDYAIKMCDEVDTQEWKDLKSLLFRIKKEMV